MRHENAGHRDMAPAEMAGADTEIVLLAVALREQVLAQQPDLASGSRAGDRRRSHARSAHPPHRSALARRARRSSRTRRGFIGQRVRAALARIAEHRCIVGKRRRGADVGLRCRPPRPDARSSPAAPACRCSAGSRRGPPAARMPALAVAGKPQFARLSPQHDAAALGERLAMHRSASSQARHPRRRCNYGHV